MSACFHLNFIFPVIFQFKGSGGRVHKHLCRSFLGWAVVACVELHFRKDRLHLVLLFSWENLQTDFHSVFICWWLFCGYYLHLHPVRRVVISTLMPPSVHDLHFWTITELLQTLFCIFYELARRFRVPVPTLPVRAEEPTVHCQEQCLHCTATCLRVEPGHRRHLCRAHWGL